MKLGRLIIICCLSALLMCCGNLYAQVYSTGRESKKAVVNFTELANYYKAHPVTRVRKLPFDEDEEEENPRPVRHRVNPSKVHLINREAKGEQAPSSGALLPESPAPNDTFLSTGSPGTDIPPDTHGAVDSQYCVTAINTDIHIQTRTGGNVSDISLEGFWASVLPAGDEAFDPRVHYDPYNQRWIMVTDAVEGTTMTNSYFMVAVSETNDPTGSWYMYAISVDPTGASWMDFPCIGFNQKWVTVTGNMFANTLSGVSGANVYVIDYSSMRTGAGAPFTEISESSSFTLCPALTFDPTEPNMYAIEVNSAGTGKLQLWEISGPVASPTIASVGYPATTQHWHNGGSADFVPQAGTAHKIQAGDDRITNLTYRNHTLWCAHTVFLPDPGTASRCSIMWWQIDTLANPIQNGLINDASTPTFFDYPSISVNVNNDALIGFGYLSPYIHPCGAYALHMHTDPLDSMRAPFVFRHGQTSYYETFGGSQNRWGDFSATCVDPRNDSDFWTIQESDFVGPSPNWDTWWANIQLCSKPSAPALVISPAAPCIGDTATYAINSIPGATSYTWLVTGTGWSGASTDTSITLTAGTGTATIGILAYNSCGEGETTFFTITPAVIPAMPIITTVTQACIGGPDPVFSATSSGSSGFNWTASGTGWSGVSSATSFSPSVTGTATGTVICIATNACGSSTPDTLLITPGIIPVTTFSVTAHSTLSLVNDVFTFTGTAPTGSTYTWSFDGGSAIPGTGAGPQTVSWTYPGLYTITLTVDNGGCYSTYTDTVLVGPNLGVNGLSTGPKEINIQPNPNGGNFSIVFNQPVNNPITVKMVDVDGRIVYENRFNSVNSNSVQVVTNHLLPGTYAVTIYSDQFVVTKEITIIK